jgi:hypothetical protein
MMTGEQRYFHDPAFKYLVDFMLQAIIDHKFTPSEMRDAAMVASIKYEMTHTRRLMDAYTMPTPQEGGEP